jgi:hypothetical protein
MNEYKVGSICEVIDVSCTSVFKYMLNEIVTISGHLRPHKYLEGIFVYDVNSCELTGIDSDGDVCVYTPRHQDLKLITPPPEGKGLELVLGMFPKIEETVV